MKKIFKKEMVGVVLSTLLIGCGGGGGTTSSSASTSTLSGAIKASNLKGIKVCVTNKNICATTDDNGNFKLEGAEKGSEVELKIGDSILGKIVLDEDNKTITPELLADNNSTLAAYVGTFLHLVANCEMNSQICDFSNISNVDIDNTTTLTLLEELKKAYENNSTLINFTVDGNTKTLSDANVTLYQNTNPQMVNSNEFKFSGAASAGDFATFIFDKENLKLTYQIDGNVFSSQSGSRNLVNLFGNVFFKDKANDGIFYFISQSLGVASIPLANGEEAFIVGLQTPPKDITSTSLSLYVNKTYNYMEFTGDGVIRFDRININRASENDLNGTWTTLNGGSGRWIVNGNHIEFYDGSDKVANIILKPGISRNGIIVDLIGNTPSDRGFGIGIEAKPLKESELKGTFYYNNSVLRDEGEECYGKAIIDGTQISYEDSWCEDSDDKDQGVATLELNPTINGVQWNGVAKLEDGVYVFIDAEDGFYVLVDMQNGSLNIGSNKPIQ